MVNAFRCPICGGRELYAETDDELIVAVQRHYRSAHAQEIAPDAVLGLAFEVAESQEAAREGQEHERRLREQLANRGRSEGRTG